MKSNAKGNVYRAIDLRHQKNISLKVIKEGRQYCLDDRYGRDIRTRLRHQESVHNSLVGSIPIPKADPYFEYDGNGYLPLEYISGKSIEEKSEELWNELCFDEKVKRIRYLIQLVDIVSTVHNKRIIHRDLSASNIWITDTDKVYLLDLELAHRMNGNEHPFESHTPG
ncbi:MAG TPA: protein kinase, partial [Nitrososphaeraceae archaeon]|nr:protein kinase [Nitrososphaeraceae archaeon]